ncbi:glycogen/starch synthase, ADP-glucose type [Chloroherpeton thalassium ATCC 35110]|uniref:Glycogen synthase n=1 Tax=Chloroherpeton thalassium (strain ATCC 35110 / GB-78) TaxID=517418 RepID=B3QWY6_CHLT3|nr:glycogen synthase GlgA [Chloroherpeton thalassium]ACF13350.1 glycogen/starch synthase, ADP-glucose type [Chloroherpeton thalassium ATCC 35110]
MDKKLKIAMITSECFPFAKTGGLADVVGALPKALKKLGHEVIIIMPKYSVIDTVQHNIHPYWEQLGVWMGNTLEWCAVHRSMLDQVPVYFIEYNNYFDREGIYHDNHHIDYQDNPKRYGFFSRAALQLCHDLNFDADIIHAHDWQTALVPAYLKIWHWDDPVLGKAASVLTIHNIGYQGKYSMDCYDYLGLQRANFTPDKFEDYGSVNFLKGGIYYADVVNTVSPTYANETRMPEYAWGMAPYLNNRADHYMGILNGIDYEHWDPAIDPLIPANFSPENMEGKKQCKEALQDRFMLDINPNIPLIGVISRFAHQKGLDTLAEVIENIVNDMMVQFVIIGSGEKHLESYYWHLPARYHGRIGTYIGYNNELAHWVEAGADFFLMPSIYEPCGLNQMYSLKYGTLPIVRATGGLMDTVEQYNEANGDGTGFKFWDAEPYAIYYTVGWAVSTYYDRKHHMEKLIRNAMSQHFSWEDSAHDYLKAYEKALAWHNGL